jgi:hypothetical protein
MIDTLAALLLALTLHAADDDRIICVAAADGRTWECGKGADAPAPRPLPGSHTRAPVPAPPPFLMDPSRAATLSQGNSAYADYPPSAAPAPTAARSVATAPTNPPAPAAVPVVDSAPKAAAAPIAATQPATAPAKPGETQPTPPAVVRDTPTPAPAPIAAPEPAPVSAPAAAPISAPTPATVQATGLARASSDLPRGAAELLLLPGNGYTVQLAAARSSEGFTAFARKLGVERADTYVIRVHRGTEDWSLLLWRDFPDLASARSAAATLNGSFWPRRLAPLHSEIRASAQ